MTACPRAAYVFAKDAVNAVHLEAQQTKASSLEREVGVVTT